METFKTKIVLLNLIFVVMNRHFFSIVAMTAIFAAMLTSCSKDDGLSYSYSSEHTIYSASNQRILRELMFILTQLATRKLTCITYRGYCNFQLSIMGDYGFFSHFRICLFKF